LDWVGLATFGPPAFHAYARLRLIPDPAFSGQDVNDVEEDDELDDLEQLRRMLALLAPHTPTPDDGWFCVWDGHGELHPGAFSVQTYGTGTLGVPQYAPALPAEVVGRPKVVLPRRTDEGPQVIHTQGRDCEPAARAPVNGSSKAGW
jgi:hypothetical protein